MPQVQTAPAASATVRRIGQGEVIGLVTETGAHAWRGLPFAASTAGDARWRAPQPAPPWEGRREATRFAERCAQLTTPGDEDEGLKPGLLVGSEDCLALDIYAPPDAEGKALPVMVWIHGGYNVWGRSSSYDGSLLAQAGDVIVVAVQYRLGPLGWFAHPLVRESARDPLDAAASFATLDLVAALRWVRDNIAAFGGDPGRVTVFGESAGGHNVVTLLASPLAKGLFHRAIVQSGAFESLSIAEAQGDEGTVRNPSNEIVDRLGVQDAEELRAVPVGKLLGAYQKAGHFIDVPRVIADGVALPATPMRDAFASTHTFNAVPVITGTNRDEMKLFFAMDEQKVRKSLGVFPVARDQDYYDAVTRYVTRVWRIRSVDGPAAMMAAAGHDQVYTYRFDWDDGGRFLTMHLGRLFGAAHTIEIPFVFGVWESLGDADRFLFQKRTLPDRERLSRAMMRYWTSFARDGVPSCDGAPAWPVHGTEAGASLRFDTDNDGGIERIAGADDIEQVAADLAGDPSLSADDRCRIVAEMREWYFARPVQQQLAAATGCA